MGSGERGDKPQNAARPPRWPAGTRSQVARGEVDPRFLAAIVESSDDAIIGKNVDGIILSWNRGAERAFGYSAEEVVGSPMSLLIPPELPNDVPRIMERLQTGKRAVRYETVRMARDGRRLDVLLTVSPIFDDAGEFVGASTVARNITDHDRPQEYDRLLARAGEELPAAPHPDAVLDRLAGLLVSTVADYCLTYRTIEGGGIRRVGLAHSDPELRPLLLELEAAGPAGGEEDPVRRAIETGRTIFVPQVTDDEIGKLAVGDDNLGVVRALAPRSSVVVPLRTRDRTIGAFSAATVAGGKRPFEEMERSRLMELADLAALALDNAELHARRLESERARLEQLFDRAPAFIAVLRGPDHVIELTNPRFRVVVGGRRLAGLKAREALPELKGQGYFMLMDEVFRTGKPYTATGARVTAPRLGKRPAREFFVNFVYEPLREPDGTVSGIFVHGVDVTALVRARERAQAAVRSRDEMLAFVSHDLRQPIGLLGTVIHVLRELDLPEAERDSVLERAVHASEQADRLIDDLMDVARSDLGRLELKLSVVGLASLIEGAVDAFREQARSAGVHLEHEVPDDVPRVHADADRIQRVLSNLLTNAIRHTPREGKVTVGAREEDDAVVCFVADTGPGIPEEEQPRVFDRFWQGDAKGGVGMGLGLSIAKEIVERHDGRIWLESAAGRGCTFCFRLPVLPVSRGVSRSREGNG